MSVYDERVEQAMADIERHARVATRMREAFIEDVQRDGVQQAVTWAGEKVVQENVATRWGGVLVMLRQGLDRELEIRDALALALHEARGELTADQARNSTTSSFANAVRGAQAEGASRFIRDASCLLADLIEAETS